MNKRTIVGGCVTMSLLAGVLVGGNSYHNLMAERNGLHDSLTKLQKQHSLDSKGLEDSKKEQRLLIDENQQLFDDSKSLQNQIRSLNQDVKGLQKDLKQEKQKQKEWLSFKATYYDSNEPSTGKSPGDPAYGMTASGEYVQSGVTVAVDPNVIPLGSWIEVMYPNGKVEKRRADDTGSAIKGQHVDIYVPRASLDLGVDQVRVRILSKPSDRI